MIRVSLLGLVANACLTLPLAADPLPPVPFRMTEPGQMRDPTGLWSPAEVAEGGSDVQPSIRHAAFPVRGGTVTMAVLVGAWCGIADCPMRFRAETDDGRLTKSFDGTEYGMVCQNFEDFTYDPEAGMLYACTARIDLLPKG